MVTGPVPDPAGCTGVVFGDASVLLVPHSNHAVAGLPFGFTVPVSVAPPGMPAAVKVVTAGGDAGVDLKAMVNVRFQLLTPVWESKPSVCCGAGETL
jgi:hypothetical protein